MSSLLSTLKNEGGDALRKSALVLAASAICVISLTFVAAAIAIGAATVMPDYAALLLAGFFLAAVAAFLILMASREAHHHERAAPSAIDQSALELISYNASKSPTKTLLAGLAAGATLGLIEAFENRQR
ncbi:MAG TPA: hypothetical protein VNH64_04080 [Parvularculaceae bacterium]|nr:hypothetical protein [Parvularculaceae bacterium]